MVGDKKGISGKQPLKNWSQIRWSYKISGCSLSCLDWLWAMRRNLVEIAFRWHYVHGSRVLNNNWSCDLFESPQHQQPKCCENGLPAPLDLSKARLTWRFVTFPLDAISRTYFKFSEINVQKWFNRPIIWLCQHSCWVLIWNEIWHWWCYPRSFDIWDDHCIFVFPDAWYIASISIVTRVAAGVLSIIHPWL
jgi:hypothetical protein